MDARTPPMLRLEDLDREELLEVLKRNVIFVSLADRWHARWWVLSGRANVAAAAQSEALGAYIEAGRATDDLRSLGTRKAAAVISRRQKAMLAYERASGRQRRLQRAADRAYAALEACREARR